uniref:tRNA N(3)-methylcytidine methyltransferase METTL2A-like n=1 Tax=Halichoerus grypus TaxID=9711 RepID=UPI00165A0424|nr:tRNA N(3)-methylcytidine methyltransferase METTL2A-like [Halichoerus grypus]
MSTFPCEYKVFKITAYISGSGVMAAPALNACGLQLGSGFLRDPARVFHRNAWHSVEWLEEQALAAKREVRENSTQRVCQEKQVNYEIRAHIYWNDFYKIHENGFFQGRHWLFTKFPGLAPTQNQNHLKDLLSENMRSEVPECRNSEDGPGLKIEEQHKCSSDSLGHKTQMPPVEENVTQNSITWKSVLMSSLDPQPLPEY